MRTYYANPDETTNATYTFHFGAYGDTHVVVFGRPDRFEDALETAAECLLEHAPGLFSEPDYVDAAREIGVALDTRGLADLPEDLAERISAEAESDHTYTESGWLLSWEWSVTEDEGEPFEAPRFDRFDVAEAWHLYWSLNHSGQWSAGYRDLCRAGRLVRNPAERFEDLSENGKALYRQLVLRDGR